MGLIDDFFVDVDRSWTWTSPSKTRLRIIGSAALMLQTDYRRGTKDSDVLETADLADETKTRLLSVGGKNTPLHERHRLYLDIVLRALPFLPQTLICHRQPGLNAKLQHFEIEVLDVVDVVVSKLKRFKADDIDDIAAMVEKGHVPHARLIERFLAAVDYSMDARASDLSKCLAALHRVERDFFAVPETEIELPEWAD